MYNIVINFNFIKRKFVCSIDSRFVCNSTVSQSIAAAWTIWVLLTNFPLIIIFVVKGLGKNGGYRWVCGLATGRYFSRKGTCTATVRIYNLLAAMQYLCRNMGVALIGTDTQFSPRRIVMFSGSCVCSVSLNVILLIWNPTAVLVFGKLIKHARKHMALAIQIALS